MRLTGEHPSLFESPKEKAIRKVGEAADPYWTEAANLVVKVLASRMDTFTTDNVWSLLSTQGLQTHEPRALGTVMKNAQREGLIEPTDNWRLSTRSACHNRPLRVWRSPQRVA